MRSASEVFVYVTLLLGFLCFERGVLVYYRMLLTIDHHNAIELATTRLWSLRTLPELIIVLLIIFRMATRACRTIRLERRYTKDVENTCEGFAENE